MLSTDGLAKVLFEVATGSADRALEAIETLDPLEAEIRATLHDALTQDDDRAAQARRLGDVLRASGAHWHLVNECYRAAFYLGDDWLRLVGDPLFSYFTSHRTGRPLDKWPHYLPIYHRHLQRFRGRPVRVLEIGVYRGGGLEMLRHYLGREATIVGVDVDADAARVVGAEFAVEIGDQADTAFMEDMARRHGPFDIIIDDGGHTMRQQITSAEILFPLVTDGGVYIVEDCHTSYMADFADPEAGRPTFMAWVAERIDDVNAYHHSRTVPLPEPWCTDLAGLHVYDSVVVFDKAHRSAPFSEISGTNDFIRTPRDGYGLVIGLMADRDAATAARDAATAARDAAFQEISTLRLETDALRGDLSRLRRDLEDSRSQVMEMRGSTSWRMTEPLRRLVSLFRR